MNISDNLLLLLFVQLFHINIDLLHLHLVKFLLFKGLMLLPPKVKLVEEVSVNAVTIRTRLPSRHTRYLIHLNSNLYKHQAEGAAQHFFLIL